jgi:hypothetical protein
LKQAFVPIFGSVLLGMVREAQMPVRTACAIHPTSLAVPILLRLIAMAALHGA